MQPAKKSNKTRIWILIGIFFVLSFIIKAYHKVENQRLDRTEQNAQVIKQTEAAISNSIDRSLDVIKNLSKPDYDRLMVGRQGLEKKSREEIEAWFELYRSTMVKLFNTHQLSVTKKGLLTHAKNSRSYFKQLLTLDPSGLTCGHVIMGEAYQAQNNIGEITQATFAVTNSFVDLIATSLSTDDQPILSEENYLLFAENIVAKLDEKYGEDFENEQFNSFNPNRDYHSICLYQIDLFDLMIESPDQDSAAILFSELLSAESKDL